MSALPAHVRTLLGIGVYRQPAGRDPIPNRTPPGIERIELVTGGRGWVRQRPAEGNGWSEVTAGSIAWQAAGDLTIARSDGDDPYRCIAVSVAVDPDGVRPVPRITRWDDVDEARGFARTALRLAGDPAADRGWLLAFVYGRLLLVASGAGAGGETGDPLRRALALLERRHVEGVALDELAREAGWSVSHLHAAFRRQLGTTPHQWLVRRRLHGARQLLAATDQSLEEIAKACGFADAPAFCRVFRRVEGDSPASWRKALRGARHEPEHPL